MKTCWGGVFGRTPATKIEHHAGPTFLDFLGFDRNCEFHDFRPFFDRFLKIPHDYGPELSKFTLPSTSIFDVFSKLVKTDPFFFRPSALKNCPIFIDFRRFSSIFVFFKTVRGLFVIFAFAECEFSWFFLKFFRNFHKFSQIFTNFHQFFLENHVSNLLALVRNSSAKNDNFWL